MEPLYNGPERSLRTDLETSSEKFPGVAHTVEIGGYSGLDGTTRTNACTVFATLQAFPERENDPARSGTAILGAVRRQVSRIPDAFVLAFPPPPVQGDRECRRV